MPLRLEVQTESARATAFSVDMMRIVAKDGLDRFMQRYGGGIRRWGVGGTAEETAFLAFQAYCRFIQDSGFVYSFLQTGTPWQAEAWDDDGRLYANCLNLALGFNILLFHLGFPAAALHLQQSLPQNDNGKISQKSGGRITGANVRGIAGMEAPSPYVTAVYPQAQILATNALHIRRGSWWPGRHYHDQVVSKSHRDIFHNHWCCELRLPGLAYRFFDPLMASRYRNGQDDMFEAFSLFDTLTYKRNADTLVYRGVDDPQAMLYTIPAKFHDVTDNAVYKAMREATRRSAPPGGDFAMYWRIDPGEDWFDRNILGGDRGAALADASPHPLFAQQLFHLCKTDRWSRTVAPLGVGLPV
jgi:hypothetical protein